MMMMKIFATIRFKRPSVGGTSAPPPHKLTIIMKKFDEDHDDVCDVIMPEYYFRFNELKNMVTIDIPVAWYGHYILSQ